MKNHYNEIAQAVKSVTQKDLEIKIIFDEELAKILGEFDMIPVTYAGGIASLEDIEHFRKKTGGKVDFTIGSALDLFGGHLPYEQIKKY